MSKDVRLCLSRYTLILSLVNVLWICRNMRTGVLSIADSFRYTDLMTLWYWFLFYIKVKPSFVWRKQFYLKKELLTVECIRIKRCFHKTTRINNVLIKRPRYKFFTTCAWRPLSYYTLILRNESNNTENKLMYKYGIQQLKTAINHFIIGSLI